MSSKEMAKRKKKMAKGKKDNNKGNAEFVLNACTAPSIRMTLIFLKIKKISLSCLIFEN